ncbi:MAG: hypothetical protein V2I97_03235 [Desulfococcaceae bacterium]|jgi:thymidylate kinase|nr:hypothetical protein [Desulfococcaceae bacterium]
MSENYLPHPPEVLLILGTDASGKNHVTNFITEEMKKRGYETEKRDGWFSKKPSDVVSSEGKGPMELMKEKVFLTTFPFTKYLMPALLYFLLRGDLAKFQKSTKKVIVISHTALRILVFYLGHVCLREENIPMPRYLDKILKEIVPRTGVKSIVLDIADEIRKKRIRRRMESGNADNFDLYMAKDRERSERIDSFLVWLGKKYLNAVVIENNDPDDATLFSEISAAFARFRTS